MVTSTGRINIYTCVDNQWIYTGAPPSNELKDTIKQYQRQYGKQNVKISKTPNKLVMGHPWKNNRHQQHANTRSAIKRAINTESNWAYRSKTLVHDSLWRK